LGKAYTYLRMSATLGKNPVPTGSAAAFQVVVHSLTNVHSSCPWYIKCKLGYTKKQKSRAMKQVNNAIQFDETFYYERWDQKDTVQLSVWKEKNKLKHVVVASMELVCPSSKQYPSCTYELKTELFPVGSMHEDGVSARARANTALEGQGIDANKPCGEITITVTHVPGHTRWLQHQFASGVPANDAAENKSDAEASSNSQQSKKAELMKAAAEHKAEKDHVKESKPEDKPEESKPQDNSGEPKPDKPAENPAEEVPDKPAENPAEEVPKPAEGEAPAES